MALIPTAAIPPIHELPLESDGQFSRPWTRYFQAVTNALVAMGSTAAGGLGSLGIAGAVDGSDAAAGDIGEYLQADTTTLVALTTAVTTDVLTLSLSPGDWDVAGWISLRVDGGTSVAMLSWGVDTLDEVQVGLTAASDTYIGGWTGPSRRNVTVPTVVTLRTLAVFTGTIEAAGRLRARRMR